MSEKVTVKQLEQRLARFEAQEIIRSCMNKYMAICDDLDAKTDLDELMGLFSDEAVWEGVGRYAKSFGRLEGQSEIRAMFAKYTVEPSHFSLNVHFLTNEEIEVLEVGEEDQAIGNWLLLQTSTFASGKSQLSCAKITARFEKAKDGEWRIAHFQTERKFSRPVVDPWEAEADLPVPE
ncbi:MAG: nuclear transport factor 2 family protein [Methylocystaceae bacterium]|nr:nuclear transport factor 2 family protein [Methylocystaceae bacterium]